MTSDDHLHDALITALRSPARPDELAGEDDAVAAMCAAYQPVPARPGSRSRRGVVLAVVTVASLGVGGLAAAGPGVLRAPFTSPFTWGADRTVTDDGARPGGDDPPGSVETPDSAPGPVAEGSTGSGVGSDETGGTGDGPGRTPGTSTTSTTSTTTALSPTTPDECARAGTGAPGLATSASSVPAGRQRGEATSDAARAQCDPVDDPAATSDPDMGGGTSDPDDDTGGAAPGRSGEAPGQGGAGPGVGNDGTPGPPASTPGQGQPPTNPGQGAPPADPGRGQPPGNPGPPAQPPGQGGGNDNGGGGNNGGGNGGNGGNGGGGGNG